MIDHFDKEPEVIAAINNNRKIEAVKLLRESRGVGLKEAKDLVDQYAQAHGLSEVSSGSSNSASNSDSNLKWIVIVALAAFGFYIFRNYF